MLALWTRVPIWCSLLCLTDFQDGEVCWQDPGLLVCREGQAIAVFFMGPGVELDILTQSIQPRKAQGSRVSMTLCNARASLWCWCVYRYWNGIAVSSVLQFLLSSSGFPLWLQCDMKNKPKKIMILLLVGLDSQCAATTFLSSCDLVLPLFILFCGFLGVERGAHELTLNRRSEIQAPTLTDWDTFLCPSAWCSPCSQFWVHRPFTPLLLQCRNSIGLCWVVYLWGWRDS